MKVLAIFLISLSLALAIDLPREPITGRDVPPTIGEIKESLIKKAVAMGNKIEETLQVYNVTKCIYTPSTQMISCRGLSEEIECPVVFHATEEIVSRVFGLGIVPELVDVVPEKVRYWLYPRQLDNITYVDHSVVVGGVTRPIVLYYGDEFIEYGLRVTDLKCYQRIVGLIRGSSTEREVILDVPTKPVVRIFGEVLVMDKVVSKRWGWGYGWGLGGLYGGWGWRGLGWGYPIVYGK